jgi:hypothetical protein
MSSCVALGHASKMLCSLLARVAKSQVDVSARGSARHACRTYATGCILVGCGHVALRLDAASVLIPLAPYACCLRVPPACSALAVGWHVVQAGGGGPRSGWWLSVWLTDCLGVWAVWLLCGGWCVVAGELLAGAWLACLVGVKWLVCGWLVWRARLLSTTMVAARCVKPCRELHGQPG